MSKYDRMREEFHDWMDRPDLDHEPAFEPANPHLDGRVPAYESTVVVRRKTVVAINTILERQKRHSKKTDGEQS